MILSLINKFSFSQRKIDKWSDQIKGSLIEKPVLRVNKDDSKRSTELTLKITKSSLMGDKITFFKKDFLFEIITSRLNIFYQNSISSRFLYFKNVFFFTKKNRCRLKFDS